MGTYYVYILKDQTRNNEPFYVGKGTRYRYRQHFTESEEKTVNIHKHRRIKKIQRETNDNPIVEFAARNLTNEDACKLEIELIAKYGKHNEGGILTNRLDGGDCPPVMRGEDHYLFGKKCYQPHPWSCAALAVRLSPKTSVEFHPYRRCHWH